MKNFWISWFGTAGAWELHTPWWISGYRIVADRFAFDEERQEPTVVAAVKALNADEAKQIILDAHDTKPKELEWRFVEERPDDWTPFSGRFPRAAWMQWS